MGVNRVHNKKKAKQRSVLLAVSILLISVASFLSISFMEKQQKKILPTAVPEYGIQGLGFGIELTQIPVKINTDYVHYSDRVLEVYHANDENKKNGMTFIESFMNVLPGSITKSLILVPTRIAYEDEALKYSDDPLITIKAIQNGIDSNITTVDVDSVFQARKEEYLFYRTDGGWTSLGAYYVAEKYLETLGIEIIDINEYNAYMFENYVGIYYLLPDEMLGGDDTDYVGYYLKPEGENKEILTAKVDSDLYETYEAPTVALSRRGTNIFVAGQYSHAVLKGDGNNQRNLMVVGDSNAKVFSTWMTPYFENVYVINGAFYQNGKTGFGQIFKDYHITDMVMVESIDTIEDPSKNTKLRDLYKQELK